MTVSTSKRADLVNLISALLLHLKELGDNEDSHVFYTAAYDGGSRRERQDNCRAVRRKLFELLDESGAPRD